jgi:hypothetical protein
MSWPVFTGLRTLFFATLLAACASKQGTKLNDVRPPPAPTSTPESWDFSDTSKLPESREQVMAACEWLLDVAPATANSKEWVRNRDFALDWIEASDQPEIPVTQPIVAYVAMDPRFLYGAYMRGAYQCGKAKWVVANPSGDARSFEAELAGIDGMARLMRPLQEWDRYTKSRRLNRYLRKQKSGKLEAFLSKTVATGGKQSRRKKK